MSRYGQRPENALKRANEFIDVGKPSRALDTLYEVFRNKKWTYSWSESVLEPIMFKYLDLCVELKKSLIAKEGLFQYRNMFQSVNVGSLENVIRGYLRMAEEKTEAAREQSQQAIIDIDDLDNLATPESILLSAVSGEDAQDRSDRTILTPWVKFLWESYCQCLELLRTNAHCETLYHDIARMAFQFCLKYNRKTEFRKLCDKLRKHLEDIAKLPVQVANVSLNKPETQQYNLETRLVQLDSAIQMELWQEAYKAIEDIHGLMNMSKKPPVPKTMANYYQKLAMVFWKAGQYLFHAAALFKLFQLSKDMKKNITSDELQRMACRVLLATLCIPLPSAHPEFDRFIETDKSPLEKAQRLAILLTLQQPPTRATLIRDLVRMNVVQLASPQLQELYQCLELDFNPLTLCKRVQAITDQIQGDEQYVPPLQDVTLVKLIKQVSQVYQSIKFARLLELTAFTTPFHLERVLVDCVRHNDMQIRIEHSTNSVHFGVDLVECPRQVNDAGPVLQSMPSEQLRTQLINMSHVLNSALRIINPNHERNEKDKVRLNLAHHYRENMHKEHQRILGRHKIIEDRKEYLERLNIHREEEEAKKAEEAARQQALAEQKRLEEERRERERKRQENELQLIKDRHLQERMNNIRKTARGQRMLRTLDEEEIKKLNPDDIAAKEAEEAQKEKREMQQKLKSQEKKIDYFERAKRIEEIPLLQKAYDEKQVLERKRWEDQEEKRIEELTQERQKALEHRKRLGRMTPDCTDFINMLKSGRNQIYLDKMKEFENRVTEERKKRLAQRKEDRKKERIETWEREKEEERVRKEEEEEKKRLEEERMKKEEEERIEAAKRAEKEEEERKRVENLNRQAEMARKREEEAVRRLEEKMTASKKADEWRKGEEANSRPEPPRPAPPAQPWRSRLRDGGNESGGGGGGGGTAPPPPPPATGGASSWRTRGGDDERRDRDDRRGDDRDRRGDDRDRRGDDRDRRGDDRDRRGDDRDRRVDDRDRRGDDRDRRGDDRDRRGDDRDRRGDDRDRRDREDRDRRPDDDKFRKRDFERKAEPASMSCWRRGPEPEKEREFADRERREERRMDDRQGERRMEDRERKPEERERRVVDTEKREEKREEKRVVEDKKAVPPVDQQNPPEEKKEWRTVSKASGEDSGDGDDGTWKKVSRR